MVDFNEESTSQYGYATLAKISALAASESLDVVIEMCIRDSSIITQTCQGVKDFYLQFTV